ncbi:capsular polysaccharide biosynthesis protein [Desulfitispora alkaliphila]|uniref:GumC family protein n=1 Tax=Desulfitispora alkaliphila TaxID=622674 RepID=UPI003D1D0FF0
MTQEDRDREELQEIDLKELLGIIFKWKWMIAALTFVAVMISGVISYFVLPPVYETKTVLMVTHASDNQRHQSINTNGIENVANTLSRLPEMTMNTYVDQIKNEKLLKEVVESLNLDRYGYSHRTLNGMVSANAIQDTNLIEVKVTNTDPALAALIANKLSEEFVRLISEQSRDRMGQSVVVLNEQINSIEADLQEANDAIREFNSQPRGITYIEEQLKANLADLTKYQSMLIEARIELDQHMAGKNQIEQTLANTPAVLIKESREERESAPVPEETENEEGLSAIEPLVVTQITEEPNPHYHELQHQLQIKNSEVAQKQARVNSITSVISSLERNVKGLQSELTEQQSEYTKLTRTAERLEQNHEIFSERLAQTQIFQSIDIGESSIQVVAPAMEPTSPFKPNKSLNVAIAFVLAVMVGVFLAFVLEFFDNNIKNAEDVKRHLDLPVVGSIPKMDKKGQ